MIKKSLRLMLVILVTMFGATGTVWGQDSDSGELEKLRQQVEKLKPGNTTFLMRGYAHAGFEIVDKNSSFVSGTFAPIFLWQQSDRILFEAEAEIAYAEEGVEFALEYANISYILSDYFVMRFGNFLTPFGIFGERLHPNWINRFPSNPLGFDHHNPVGPFAEFGVELRGSAPLGNAQFNYALYLSNGPNLSVDTDVDPITVETSYGNFSDNNDNKAIGGRFGLLPFSNSMLEVGFSTQYAKLGDRGTPFEDLSSMMYALDLTFVKNGISAIRGGIDLKAQWNYVDQDPFQITDGTGNVTNVHNDQSAFFTMLSYRPAMSGSDFISKIELVGRFSSFNVVHENSFVTGGGDGHTHNARNLLGPILSASSGSSTPASTFNVAGPNASEGILDEDKTQWAAGINYWLTWRSVIKFSYQITQDGNDIPAYFIHYALGF